MEEEDYKEFHTRCDTTKLSTLKQRDALAFISFRKALSSF